MELNNQKYKNQMISVDISIFSIINNELAVLLVKRKQPPFEQLFSLIGGGVYNDETCENAVERELLEKLNLQNITPHLSGVFSEPGRDPRFRNISVSFFALVKDYNLKITNNENKVLDTKWFYLNELPKLAFDHNDILNKSLVLLQQQVYDIKFLKQILPSVFTLNDLQKIYESILQTKLDKRNFRRKISSLNYLVALGEKNMQDKHKKSELYKLK